MKRNESAEQGILPSPSEISLQQAAAVRKDLKERRKRMKQLWGELDNTPRSDMAEVAKLCFAIGQLATEIVHLQRQSDAYRKSGGKSFYTEKDRQPPNTVGANKAHTV